MEGVGTLIVIGLCFWALIAYFSGHGHGNRLLQSVNDDGEHDPHMHDVKRRMSALYEGDEELRKLRESADLRREEARKYLVNSTHKEASSKRVVGMKKRSD